MSAPCDRAAARELKSASSVCTAHAASTANRPSKYCSILDRDINATINIKNRGMKELSINKKIVTPGTGDRACLSSPNRDTMIQEATPSGGSSSHMDNKGIGLLPLGIAGAFAFMVLGSSPAKGGSMTENDIRYENITSNIQSAIDEVATSDHINKLIVTGDHIFTTSLLLYGDNKDYEFLGSLQTFSNDAIVTMGTAITPLRHSYVKMSKISGVAIGSGDGIKMVNVVRCTIFVNNFVNLSKGIHIYADGTYETAEQGYVQDNQIFFNDMRFLDYGIYYNPDMTGNAEGNQFQGSIFGTRKAGLYIRNGIGKSSHFTGYNGVIDCVWDSSSKEVDDIVGQNTYIFRFIHDTRNPAINVFQFENSLVWNAYSGTLEGKLRLGKIGSYGIGNQYACFNNDGSIYGSHSPCV